MARRICSVCSRTIMDADFKVATAFATELLESPRNFFNCPSNSKHSHKCVFHSADQPHRKSKSQCQECASDGMGLQFLSPRTSAKAARPPTHGQCAAWHASLSQFQFIQLDDKRRQQCDKRACLTQPCKSNSRQGKYESVIPLSICWVNSLMYQLSIRFAIVVLLPSSIRVACQC